jgi:hypothetical protein
VNKDSLNKDKVNKDGVLIEAHHPYYRKLIKDYAKSIGLKSMSLSKSKFDHHDDSDLLKHYNCDGLTPRTKIYWHDDIGECTGSFMGHYGICKHCGEHFLSEYENDKDSLGMGYEYIKGKNCVLVSNKIRRRR